MALKLPSCFYPLIEKALSFFKICPPYCQVAWCNQKTPITVSQSLQVRCEKAKKEQVSTLATTYTKVHLPKPISVFLLVIWLLPSQL